MGYAVVDLLVEHYEDLGSQRVTGGAARTDLEIQLREQLPEAGSHPLDVLAQLERDVFPRIMHLDHPRFFAFVPGPSNYIGVMADALASGLNVFAGTWLEAAGPAQIELVTVDWLRQACGLPEGAGGLFVSGGSMANITALATARHVRLRRPSTRAIVYCSDQTHSSIARGLRVLGFEDAQLCVLPTDCRYCLDVASFVEAIHRDRSAGRIPFCLVANAGTTNTGAVDPLVELAGICRQEELWLHVDGAYGAPAVLCDRGRAALAGLECADSLSLDPHKWLFQPYEIGCILVRDQEWLKDAFQILPEYLEDAESSEGDVNFCDYGVQLTRGFRALKLWMSFQVFGASGFRVALERGFRLAEVAEDAVRDLTGWMVVTPAQLGVVTFRCVPTGLGAEACDRHNRQLVKSMMEDGWAMISSTVLRGRTVLRMCTINPRASEDDVRQTVRRLAELSRAILAS